MIKYNSVNRQLARNNRANPTEAERLLWTKIRRKQIKGFQFYRQRPLGDYIVDFYCPSAKLAVEIDGGGHFKPEQIKADSIRTQYLEDEGLKIVRFNNTEVLTNIDGVLEVLFSILD